MTKAITPQSIKSILSQLIAIWHHDSAQIDAELLLCHVLKVDRTYLYTWPEKVLDNKQVEQLAQLAQRRTQGEPIAYIVGHRAFWSLALTVTPDVLIPRPETELLVETTLDLLADKNQANILELGTGSGAIICSLAKEKPHWQFMATDISHAALTVARENAQQHQLNHIKFAHGNWFDPVPKQYFDAIISNPPYIAAQDPHLNQGDCRFEPQHALTAGQTGLEALEKIIAQAKRYLTPNGWLLLEHGYDQAASVAHLFAQYNFQAIEHRQDLAGIERMTLAQKKP